MKTSNLFEILTKSDLTSLELKVIETLEESFTDITPEGQSDYLSFEDFFKVVENLFSKNDDITSKDLKDYIKKSSVGEHDLLFLDGLNSLSECLNTYPGKDNLEDFKYWVYSLVKKAKV